MGLRYTSKQPEALMCKTVEHLATSRGRTMAPLIGNLLEPRGCNDAKVGKFGQRETSSKWKMHSC